MRSRATGSRSATRRPHERGTGWFRLRRPGSFGGEYLAEGNARTLPWQGWRGFDGLWDTSLGRLRLVQETGRVSGSSELDAGVALEGDLEEGGRLPFRVEGPTLGGGGLSSSTLSATCSTANGPRMGSRPASIGGQRVMPRPGLTWLVVLEAHWQRALDDSEFAFGHMLHELFARLPRAQVRHRFYHDEASLLHWCRQLLYLPEPSVLVITGHGETTGLSVGGKIIGLSGDRRRPAACRRPASSSTSPPAWWVRTPGRRYGRRRSRYPAIRPGSTGPQSALTEFIYLDMILEKGLTPARAAEQLLRLVRFAGNEDLPGSPYRPAGFCFVDPDAGLPDPCWAPCRGPRAASNSTEPAFCSCNFTASCCRTHVLGTATRDPLPKRRPPRSCRCRASACDHRVDRHHRSHLKIHDCRRSPGSSMRTTSTYEPKSRGRWRDARCARGATPVLVHIAPESPGWPTRAASLE